jgi:alpha-beta hydrolase superfamily lysophospholipase
MKMKLTQRLLVRYHLAKLKAIGLVSSRRAAEKAFELFCTPFPTRGSKIPPVFHKAEKLSFKSGQLQIRGFRWQPEHPNGKKILILHGYSSNAYKFERYVSPLLKEGFEVCIFNAPAHGNSEGKMINALIYRNMVLEAEKMYGPFYGLVGHSLGGLAASLVFEKLHHHNERKLVLIAPATETTTAINNFFLLLPLDQKIRDEFPKLIKEISGEELPYFSTSRVVQQVTAPVLWIHDKDDTICPYKDVKPLLKLKLPNVTFIITEGLGHNRIYKETSTCRSVVEFLTADL